MKNKIISIFSLLLIISCKENKKKTEELQINNNEKMTETILKKQLLKGSSGLYENSFDVETYFYTIEDLNGSIPILSQVLKKNNFLKVDDQNFNNIILKVFGRSIDRTSNNHILSIDFKKKCSKKIEFYRNDNSIDIKPFVIYIIKDHNFITELYALPEIMDYQKEFLSLIDFENKTPNKIITQENDTITISKWKDIPDLVQQRKKNSDLLVNRNKYLFNDNKASLVWLKFNDQEFLEALVKIFGYVEDQDLLKWVLDRNLNDKEFDKILFTKTCDNKYVFHKEIFEIMNKADKNNKEKYIAFLKEHFPKVDKNNFSDETKIQALYCYYSTKLSGSISVIDVYGFFPRLNDEESEQEFKKNNYYNLPDFKELYNETRFSGVGPAE